jgi:alpha-1,3-rhamnosyl/mannosyltransferase
MRVLFNTKPILNQKTGIGFCIQNLVEQLRDKEGIELVLSHDLKGVSSALVTKKISSVIKSVLGPLYPRSVAAAVYNLIINRYASFPQEDRQQIECYDIYHEMSHRVLPGIFDRADIRYFIADIHDLSPVRYPEFHLQSYVDSVAETLDELLCADIIMVKTNFIKNEVFDYFNLPLSRIRVVPNAPSFPYRVLDPSSDDLRARLTRIIPDFPEQPFILYTGTVEPRKNLETLIHAFSRFRHCQDFVLVLAGGLGWKYEGVRSLPAELGIEDKVKFLGYQPCEVFELLYNLAEVFVYPSYYEGFGMPNIEAMQCGLPVVTSNASCLPEVVGDAALLFDPQEPDDLASQLDLIVESSELQDDLRRKGFLQSSKYKWEAIAEQTLSIYTELTL